MKKISLDEMKQIQIDMLDQLAAYCDAHHLRYFLAYGTLIGAIRHKGFIPWDDDIDVAMPREDYEKFIANFYMDGYKVVTPYNDPNYLYPFAKMFNSKTRVYEHTDIDMGLGVYVDIFPIDYIPSQSIQMYCRKRKWLEFVMTCKMAEKERDRSFCKKAIIVIFRKLFKQVNLNKIAKKIDVMSKQYKRDSSDRAGNLVMWGYGAREIVQKELFDEYTCRTFEGRDYCVPQRYHDYLTAVYGDYMKLPPEEKRVLRHDVEAYWV